VPEIHEGVSKVEIMSARNGDKARFHRLRKRRLLRRVTIQEYRKELAVVTPGAESATAAPK
jgi:hypothetical protein